MREIFSNGAVTVLTSAAGVSSTRLYVDSVEYFPDPSVGVEFFYMTLVNECDKTVEVVQVTETHTDGFTVVRAQQSTTAKSFNASTTAFHAFTADTAQRLSDYGSYYLGPQAVAPTVDNEGDPVSVGQWYFDTALEQTMIYNGTSWQPLEELSPVAAGLQTLIWELDAGHPAATPLPDPAEGGVPIPDLVDGETSIDLYLNGVRLIREPSPAIYSGDYTVDYAADEITITNAVPANSTVVARLGVIGNLPHDHDERYVRGVAMALVPPDETLDILISPGIPEDTTALFTTGSATFQTIEAAIAELRQYQCPPYMKTIITFSDETHSVADQIEFEDIPVWRDLTLSGAGNNSKLEFSALDILDGTIGAGVLFNNPVTRIPDALEFSDFAPGTSSNPDHVGALISHDFLAIGSGKLMDIRGELTITEIKQPSPITADSDIAGVAFRLRDGANAYLRGDIDITNAVYEGTDEIVGIQIDSGGLFEVFGDGLDRSYSAGIPSVNIENVHSAIIVEGKYISRHPAPTLSIDTAQNGVWARNHGFFKSGEAEDFDTCITAVQATASGIVIGEFSFVNCTVEYEPIKDANITDGDGAKLTTWTGEITTQP